MVSPVTPARAVADVVLTTVFVAFATFFLFTGARDSWTGRSSEVWPVTKGVVLQSDVIRIPGHGRVAPSYTSVVQYRYEVATRTYVSDRVSFGRLELGGGEADAEEIVRRYAKGREVTVHYLPSAPEIAVLAPGTTPSAVVRVVVGALLAIGALLAPFLARRRLALPRWAGGPERVGSDLPGSRPASPAVRAGAGGGPVISAFVYAGALGYVTAQGAATQLPLTTPGASVFLVGGGAALAAIYLNVLRSCPACHVAFGRMSPFGGIRLSRQQCPNCGARLSA